nr:G protein-coupled receptor [Proales similis]
MRLKIKTILIFLVANAIIAESQDDVCYLEISSLGDRQLGQDQLDLINSTAQTCRSNASYLSYEIINKLQAAGESLAEFNEYIQPLAASVSYFYRIKMNIVETRGLSVDFKFPDLGRVWLWTIKFMIFDFRILNRDGTRQENCSSDFPVFRPWSHKYQTTIDLNQAIKYHKNTCATIFRNSPVIGLGLSELVDSTVKHNLLTFRATDETLSTRIENLDLIGYQIIFDTNIFTRALFSQTILVRISGIVREFDRNTLSNSSIREIRLDSSALRRFLHNNPHWLNDANRRRVQDTLEVNFDSDQMVGLSTGNGGTYYSDPIHPNPFDDASFCIFYQIELYSLNIKLEGRLIEVETQKNCTCLLLWLISNYWALNDLSAVFYDDLGLCVRDRVNLSRQCQFDKMAQRCSIEKIESLSYQTVFDIIFGLEFVKYLADVWLTPVSSVLSVIANILVIKTFRSIKRSPEYRRNKLTDKARFMWEYTYYNSWLVLFHGLIFAFGPLTTCIEYAGIYCPQIALSKFSQAYFLLFQSFVGNTVRLMANISQSLFVLFRFGLNTDRLDRFRKIRPGKLVSFCSIPAITMSVLTLFINDRFPVDELFEEDFKNIIYLNLYIVKDEAGLRIAYLVNIFMGTTLFTLFNILVDLRLLSLLRKQNAHRPKEEVENRITKMVILNGLFSFLFRLPEMVSTCLLIIHRFKEDFFPVCLFLSAHFISVCPMLFDISRFLLTLSFFENLLLLYLFNPNFKKHFRNQKRDAKKQISS